MATTTARGTKQRQSKARAKSSTSAAKAAANQRNAQKSTGPRTAAGKEKSKFNALSHGQTARSVLLPGDDPAALNALRNTLLDDLQPRNSLESALIVRIADDKWICDRSQQATAERVATRLRHEPLEQAKAETDKALELGDTLFWNVVRPLPTDRSTEHLSLDEPDNPAVAEHPAHPARVRLALEQTAAGCDWLLGRWHELQKHLLVDEVWQPVDAFKMVRLLGKHAADMDEVYDVARLLMCSLTVINAPKPAPAGKPVDWPVALSRMLASFGFEGHEFRIELVLARLVSFTARLTQLPLEKWAPASIQQARERLGAVITGEVQRIREIQAKLQAIADADAAAAPVRLWFETGPEGENSRRYTLSHKRVLNRSIGMLLTARTKSEAGEFDRIDTGSLDPGHAGDLAVAEVLPASNPIKVTAEPRDAGEVPLTEPSAHEPAAPDPVKEAPSADIGQRSPKSNPRPTTTCGDKPFLRNEANELVRGPSSVVRCMGDATCERRE